MAQKLAYVTGGMGGIGTAMCQRLHKDGFKVIAGCGPSRDFNKWLGEQKAGGYTFYASVGNVADWESTKAAFDKVKAEHGTIDILVNNAGINGPVAPTWEYPPDAWDKVLAIDLSGVFHCCRTAIPGMRAAGYGRILNISSAAGKEGVQNIAAYAAAKAGVIGYTKSIARELVGSGVLVNALAPVMTETELFREMTAEHIASTRAKIPMGRLLTIPEIAAMVAWIVGPECTFCTGFTFDLSGGRATY